MSENQLSLKITQVWMLILDWCFQTQGPLWRLSQTDRETRAANMQEIGEKILFPDRKMFYLNFVIISNRGSSLTYLFL